MHAHFLNFSLNFVTAAFSSEFHPPHTHLLPSKHLLYLRPVILNCLFRFCFVEYPKCVVDITSSSSCSRQCSPRRWLPFSHVKTRPRPPPLHPRPRPPPLHPLPPQQPHVRQ